MRFLSVGSHLCAPASFRPPFAGLPLPSASNYICPTIGHYRYSYRGLSPHKFMPMSGVHKAFQPTSLPPLRAVRAAAERGRWASRSIKAEAVSAFLARIDGEGVRQFMGSHRTPLENRHAQAPRVGEVGGRTRAEHRRPVGNIPVSHQRFTGNPSPLVSAARRWDTSGALAQLTP